MSPGTGSGSGRVPTATTSPLAAPATVLSEATGEDEETGSVAGKGMAGRPVDATRGRGPLGGERRRHRAVGVLLVFVVLLVVEAWFPFRPELPWQERRGPQVEADGAVRFDGSSLLAGRPDDPWVADVAATGRFEVRLDFRTTRSSQHGPARLLAATEDTHNAALMVGQEGADLVIRVRRAGSDPSGDPPFRLPGVFSRATSETWRTLALSAGDGRFGARLDGRVVLDEPAVPDGWGPAFRLALGDEPVGKRGWVGDLRDVVVASPHTSRDLLAPGTLSGGSGLVWASRVHGLVALGDSDPVVIVLVRLAVFVPVGLALGVLAGRRRAAIAVVVFAAVLTAGKLFVAGRHPLLGDLVVGAAGGLLGVLLGGASCRRRGPNGRRRSGPPQASSRGPLQLA
jgi:hypothetical protein